MCVVDARDHTPEKINMCGEWEPPVRADELMRRQWCNPPSCHQSHPVRRTVATHRRRRQARNKLTSEC